MLHLSEIEVQKSEQPTRYLFRARITLTVMTEVTKPEMAKAHDQDVMEKHITDSLRSAVMSHIYSDFKSDVFKLMHIAQAIDHGSPATDNSELLQCIHSLNLKLSLS